MKASTIIFGVFTIATVYIISLYQPVQVNQLTTEAGFTVDYKSISGILRSSFTSIQLFNQIVYVGDAAGSLSTWTYNSKKQDLTFKDSTRKATPTLNINPVLHLEVTGQSTVTLTKDNKLTVYQTTIDGKFTQKSVFINLNDTISKFTLMDTGNGVTHFLTLGVDHKTICLNKLAKSLLEPNPIQRLGCNQTTSNLYLDMAYSARQGIIATGDNKIVMLFKYFNDTIKYLTSVNQPKSDQIHFAALFASKSQVQKELLTTNGLWLNMIIYDENVPSAKILSSQRTQRLPATKGYTDQIAVNPDNTGQKTVIINANKKAQVFTIQKNSKLTVKNQSKADSFNNFVMHDSTILFKLEDLLLQVYQIVTPTAQDSDLFKLKNSYYEQSNNHLSSLSAIGQSNQTLVSTSVTGKGNLKLWKINNYQLQLLDTASITYNTILKSGTVNLQTLVMLPPLKTVNDTLHILAAGSTPYALYLIPLTTAGKLGSSFKTLESHSGNVTTLITNPNQQYIISAGMDQNIKIWNISSSRKSIILINTTASKDGPILFGTGDQTGTYAIFGHLGNSGSKIVNITLWKYNSTDQTIAKQAMNVPEEAHQSNLTALLLTRDQKLIISLAENGQLKLWQHQNWTIVDLLASLSLGVKDAKISLADSNKLILQTKTEFLSYTVDISGFISNGRVSKQYLTTVTSNILANGQTLFSGDQQGCIRTYSISS